VGRAKTSTGGPARLPSSYGPVQRYLDNGKEFLDEIFCIAFRKFFRIFKFACCVLGQGTLRDCLYLWVVRLVVTGSSLIRRPKRLLRCLLGWGTLTNKWGPKPIVSPFKILLIPVSVFMISASQLYSVNFCKGIATKKVWERVTLPLATLTERKIF